MRSFLLLLFSAGALTAQPIGFGIKGGLPFNDFLNAASNQSFHFDTTTNRYVLGASVELRLPFGLGVEVDALYRHFGYNWAGNSGGTSYNARGTGSAWEFPLLGKYKFKGIPLVRPYVEAGVAWDRLSGLTETVSAAAGAVINGNPFSPVVSKEVTTGFVIGAGLDIRALILHVTPEIRYTRWADQHLTSPNSLLTSNQNQAEFLVGITF